jgi:hypothetical protein
MEPAKKGSMAAVGLTVGVAALLLAPLAVYLFLRSQEQNSGLRENPADTTGRVSAKQEPRFRRSPPVFDTSDSEVPKPKPKPVPLALAPAPQPARSPVRAFPLPPDVPAGMERSRLIATFGRPNMITSEVTEGRALERFQYQRPDTGVETVIFLSSGRVVSATAGNY